MIDFFILKTENTYYPAKQEVMRLKIIFILSFLLFSCSHSDLARNPSSELSPIDFAAKKILATGLPADFVKELQEYYVQDEREKVLELNILGFMRATAKNGNLDPRIPEGELKRVRKFLREHKSEFSQVERKYKVPKEVIASLLWVETKYGRDIGSFHIPSVFFSLVQADHPAILQNTVAVAKTKVDEFSPELAEKIKNRSLKKSIWALEELKALEQMRNLKDLKTLKGSFAGAFGMAQFLPSSYLSWAKTKRKKANLFRTDDSIQSVANYLKSNGWIEDSPATHESALFHYNRDKDYVSRILRMSDCLRKKRIPSAKKSFC